MSNATVESQQTEIRILLNGEPRTVPQGLTIERLLPWLEIDPSKVAVELNREIIRKADWGVSQVQDGAQVEVVWFVGGG